MKREADKEKHDRNRARLLRLIADGEGKLTPSQAGKKSGMRDPYLGSYLWQIEGMEFIWWDRRRTKPQKNRGVGLARILFMRQKGLDWLKKYEEEHGMQVPRPELEPEKTVRCTAISPDTGKQCVQDAPHEHGHKTYAWNDIWPNKEDY